MAALGGAGRTTEAARQSRSPWTAARPLSAWCAQCSLVDEHIESRVVGVDPAHKGLYRLGRRQVHLTTDSVRACADACNASSVAWMVVPPSLPSRGGRMRRPGGHRFPSPATRPDDNTARREGHPASHVMETCIPELLQTALDVPWQHHEHPESSLSIHHDTASEPPSPPASTLADEHAGGEYVLTEAPRSQSKRDLLPDGATAQAGRKGVWYCHDEVERCSHYCQ